MAAVVGHEDGLDFLSVVEAEEEFVGESVGGGDEVDLLGLVEELGLGGVLGELLEPALEGREEVLAGREDLLWGVGAVLEGAPEGFGVGGVDAVLGEFLGEFVEGEVVEGEHVGWG